MFMILWIVFWMLLDVVVRGKEHPKCGGLPAAVNNTLRQQCAAQKDLLGQGCLHDIFHVVD